MTTQSYTLDSLSNTISDPLLSPSFHSGKVIAEYPLSYGQRALWFVQRMDPASVAHNVVHAARICADLDVDAFRGAFQQVADRQACLRTTFGISHAQPVQRIHDHVDVPFVHHDALAWTPAEVKQFMSSEIYRPFDLEHGPLMRVALLTQSDDSHIVVLSLHHIITDMWSIALLMNEVSLLYMSARTGHARTLPPLEMQYEEFVHDQAAMIAGPEGDRLWTFWQRQLGGGLPVLDILPDLPRPSVQRHRGGREFLRLGSKLTSELKSLAATHKNMLFTTVFAAYIALLYRYTGQKDILVGTPRANRTRKTASVMGYFVNPVVVRANLVDDPSFSRLLDQVHQNVSDALANGAFPFPLLVERLQPPRDLSRSQIFQVMFSWQKTTRVVETRSMTSFALGEKGARIDLNGLPVESVFLDEQAVPFDLTLLMAEASDDDLAATMEYNTSLFQRATVRRMLENFQTLLQGIVNNPDVPISTLPLLTDAERHKVLRVWNPASLNGPDAPPVHHAVEEQAEKTPDAIAAVFREQIITYRQLNERANQLARYLRRCGVGLEDHVGVCIDRSFEAIVALLAVMKAGGTYLPIDPAYPAGRINFMLDDAHVRVILTQERLLDRIPTGEWTIVCPDRDQQQIGQESSQDLETAVFSGNIAYIIYTSGSTGAPKGVLISHRALANHCRDMLRYYQLTHNDRVLQFASLSFDASLEQIFPALMTGAGLVIQDAVVWDPSQLIRKVRELGLTVINLPPAYWHQVALSWARTTEPVGGNPLRMVIIGGDVMRADTLELWQHTPARHARLLNAYGPTETTITALTHEVSSPLDGAPPYVKIPIGRPLLHRTVYVLDEHMNPVPQGVPGELYIGGAGLARGYLNRPDLSAERFPPDPFGQTAGARLYRTGDLVRIREDGNLEFIGRTDYQVKVRGFRIELGEIEQAISKHPQVSDVVVFAKEAPSGDRRLVAYIVPANDPPPSSDALRLFLKEKLPAYMMPSVFVTLPSLPLTSGGKVDRQALPQPAFDREELHSAYVAPRTAIEEETVRIWEEVLGVRQIGVHDSFFDLGGHSLLATQIISRVREIFQVDVPMQAVFETPTVAHLATSIQDMLINDADEGSVARALSELEGLAQEESNQLLIVPPKVNPGI